MMNAILFLGGMMLVATVLAGRRHSYTIGSGGGG
jgi:hypothetical protein